MKLFNKKIHNFLFKKSANVQIALSNDLGHPLADNLRQGNWMMEYITNRLQSRWLGLQSLQLINQFLTLKTPNHPYSCLSKILLYEMVNEFQAMETWQLMQNNIKLKSGLFIIMRQFTNIFLFLFIWFINQKSPISC